MRRVESWVMCSLIVSMGALAGCVQEPTEETVSPTPNEGPAVQAVVVPWGLEECQVAIALIGVAASKVSPHVPSGFRVLSAAEVVSKDAQAPFTPPNPSADGNLGIEMFVCKSGVGLNGSVSKILYGSLFAAVAPPKDLEASGTKHYFVKWDVLVPDEDRRTFLSLAGVPAVDGSASYSSYTGTGPGLRFAGALKLGADSFGFTGAGAVPAADGSFIEFTATPKGLVKWNAKYKFTGGTVGPIDVTVPAAGLAAKIVGAGTHRAAGFAGTASFQSASITIPAAG